MLTTHLDHLVIVAPSLADGVEYVRQCLGVAPQAGGEHPRMGTHNALLKIGDDMFLEVMAINPGAPRPARPRWFDLDRMVPNAAPRLATWVARTNDIHAAVAASPVPLGDIEPMTRGALNWLITIPRDGSLPLQGVAPTLIEWHNGPHPATNLQDHGCTLVGLEGFHPQADKVSAMLRASGFQGKVSMHAVPPGEPAVLAAHIRTPQGLRVIGAA